MKPPKLLACHCIALSILISLSSPPLADVASAAESTMSAETSFERPRSDVATPTIKGPRLALSIREAVSIALARNFDITIAGFDPDIAEGNVIRERSAFDPQAVVDTNISKSKARLGEQRIQQDRGNTGNRHPGGSGRHSPKAHHGSRVFTYYAKHKRIV